MKFEIPTIEALNTAYMPFVKNGGLFIPTRENYQLGDAISLLITLPDDSEEYTVPSQVVWLTPLGAQNAQAAGVGVQFNNIEKSARLDAKIRAVLGKTE